MQSYNKSFNFCNNCGKNGHLYHQCKQPITSIGIICFREKNDIEYLMIRRKDSFGYVDFMRGKYPLYNKKFIKSLINEMTIHEKHKLITLSFEELWNDLWGDEVGIQYRNEEASSKEKLENLKIGVHFNNELYSLKSIISESDTNWLETEWGFPKGRRNYQENDLQCALREFEEETGFDKNKINLVMNIVPFEEIFIGSNLKSYKQKYYIAKMNNDCIEDLECYQKTEVSKIRWVNIEDAISLMRYYDTEKIQIIKNINYILNTFELCN